MTLLIPIDSSGLALSGLSGGPTRAVLPWKQSGRTAGVASSRAIEPSTSFTPCSHERSFLVNTLGLFRRVSKGCCFTAELMTLPLIEGVPFVPIHLPSLPSYLLFSSVYSR